MIPMADNLNHSSVSITNEMINLSLHLEGANNPDYFRISKFINDYSTIFKKHVTPMELEKFSEDICGRFNRRIYERN